MGGMRQVITFSWARGHRFVGGTLRSCRAPDPTGRAWL